MSKIDDNVKELVIARLDNIPSHIKISIGSIGSFTKAELIKNVEDETQIGKKITEIQISYIKSFIK